MPRDQKVPLTIDLSEDLLEKLHELKMKNNARSVSDVIRYAAEHLDPDSLPKGPAPHRQISVRMPSGLRKRLVRLSKIKQISMGEILRVALLSLPARVPDLNPKTNMANKPTTKRPSSKTAAKKPAKKAVRRPAPAKKKAPAKKTAAKKTVKKKVAKKAPVKKAAKKKVAKKAPAKKTAVKKAAKKKVAKKAPAKKTAVKKAVKKVAKKAPAKKTAVKKTVKRKTSRKR